MPVSEELVLYFDRTYIARILPGGNQQDPIYPIKLWNHHHEVLQGIPRTNKLSKQGRDNIIRLSDVTIQIFSVL